MVAAEIDKAQETFFSELPVGWRYDRLKDIVSLRNDKTSDKSSEQNYLELEDIEQGTGNLLSKKNTLDVESAVIRFKKGDVLFGKLRPYLEKYYYADFDGKCTGEILAFYPRGIQGHFLRYCVAAPWFIGKCNALAYGTKMPRVNWPKQLALFEIPIPSNSEQQRIATYLDKTCAVIDKVIEAKQKQLEILDALRKSIIHKAVTRGLDDSVELKDSGIEWMPKKPKNWKTCRIKDALDFFNTQRVPLSADVRGVMIEKKYDYYGASGIIDKVDNYLFDGTYILIAEDGANLLMRNSPLAFLATGKFWVNNHAHILKPQFGNDQYFVYLLESLDYSLYVTGAAQPKLTKENLGKYKIIIPPRDEQNTISTFLENKTKELDGLAENIVTQISTLQQYRKSLIHECVTGKRWITDGDVQNQL